MFRLVKFNKRYVLIFSLVVFASLFLALYAIQIYAHQGEKEQGLEQHGKPLEQILSEIRTKLKLGPDEAIDPDKVNEDDLEELGEAVMSEQHPNPRVHAFMDRMMGGEGSERLRRAHIQMGYNYLASLKNGSRGWFGDRDMMMGGMMGGGWCGYGGVYPWIGLLFWLLIIGAVGTIIYLIIRYIVKNNNQRINSKPEDDPLAIAKRRLANGEITKEEFENIRKNLE